ncbi:Ribosomal large subunit pseudouridine synthase B [Mycoplasmopsis agalactiae]|uniref:Pseudouridine synthase n=1 Tax=Mycoplasmopsis agalactiae (strain NCTC 10123 / CIP 59.7 / PG2) TaxID=347257 RepID=A5IXL5_MYCAP|nr:pseudouridine synthase [Mycoplasmopsis agalactiae]MCE6056877.1 rRNA pseudouridine synthase [Mycoplasmopsis agalactiae]MCE6078666.1 rRNA pseudouridine synthase [Mycoplasmopsis agalactiae]MCE6095051.1 rRNA pseudouridine synthase [Mycoplasmopsis agalactiae]NLS34711.1 rRNA pseudouridine synthase [Mycoplasmopsis agalactiae]QYR08354.1 rRNA pseudouridine synthase [Mycoplasmopsis agalactiae]
MPELVRVQKLIAQSGLMSRRDAEKMISKGLVFVNGIKSSIGDKASMNDEIKVNGKIINLTKNTVFKYYLLNKPKNTITTSKDPKGRHTVIDLINTSERIVPVGRLDRNTTGVLLLTTDYELVNKLTHPKYEIERVYRARIDSPLTLKEFRELNAGIEIDGKMSYQIVDQVDTKSYLISLHVGSYHHVKKLFEKIGHSVLTLKRVSYANLTVDKLPEGMYRELTIKEVKNLKLLVEQQEKKLCQNEK